MTFLLHIFSSLRLRMPRIPPIGVSLENVARKMLGLGAVIKLTQVWVK